MKLSCILRISVIMDWKKIVFLDKVHSNNHKTTKSSRVKTHHMPSIERLCNLSDHTCMQKGFGQVKTDRVDEGVTG